MDQKVYDRIGKEIESDSSPVGIDAKKTHIMILARLDEVFEELKTLREEISQLKNER